MADRDSRSRAANSPSSRNGLASPGAGRAGGARIRAGRRLDRRGAARAHLALLRAQSRAQMSYRTSFLVDLVANVGTTVLDVLTVLVLFRVTPELGGFQPREVMVMVGLSTYAFATADLLVGNIERIRQHVRTGLFDTVLVRPLGALPQLLVMDVPLRKASRSVFGLAVLLVALARAGIDWTPARVTLALLAPLAGVLFFASIFVASATVSFWWIDSGEIGNAFTYGGRDFTAYPVTVYGGWFRRVFAYGLGFAFVAYHPALTLLGRADPLGLPAWLGWASPVVAVGAALAAGAIWRFGVRHYRSTGS